MPGQCLHTCQTAHLIAHCGDVCILLSVKRAIRYSADALFDVCSYLLKLVLPVAGCSERNVQCFHLSRPYTLPSVGSRE